MAQWKKTSPPVALKDTRRGGWRLKLNYTQSRRKKTLAKFSRYFETEEEARATATWWTLSWEQGNKGNYVDPHTDPDEVSSPATADLPKGKSENSMGKLNAVQERQFKKQRREGSDLSRSEWMKSTILTDREKRCLTRAWTRREAKVNKKFQNRHA
eukprot:jgi/Undpi1/7348/HiC_scaffold_22.g09821.m1